MKLLSKEDARRLQRAAVTATWALGGLLTGLLLLVGAVLAFQVSDVAGTGLWGGVAVIAVGVIVGVLAWRRYPGSADHPAAQTHVGRQTKRILRVPALPSRSVLPSRSAAPQAGSPEDDGASVPELKEKFRRALDEGDFVTAEETLAILGEDARSQEWAANSARRLRHKKRRV